MAQALRLERPRYASLIGLAFGDCGKGVFTDALCRRWQAHTVVRFNGGAQAGHNVVLPDGRHHTFSQFCAGTLIPEVFSVLAAPVVVHPTALLVEARALVALGVADALQRLVIDARCRITTPFHQAAGRLRELLRGDAAHGTCGVGVGETVRHGLAHADEVLRYADLARPARAAQLLEAMRARLAAEFRDMATPAGQAARELAVLNDAQLGVRWLAQAQELLRQVAPAAQDQVAGRLALPGTVLFEGAQGVLLDEWRGFHPHTTWSSINTGAVEAVLADAGLPPEAMHLGLLRSHLTRHGAGPLPTFDAALSALPEPHNADDGWQGRFRRGHPDAVLLRYALAAAGRIDGLLVSHLDRVNEQMPLRWCEAYEAEDAPAALCMRARATGRITGLRLGEHGDLAHQVALTGLLGRAHPVYAPQALTAPAACVEAIAAAADVPVWAGAHGPTHAGVRFL
ncbi:MAG TPA: adenylosuccinate synthetase [Burkholderiales bacterium]